MSDCQNRFCGLGGIRCDSCEKDRRISELENQLVEALTAHIELQKKYSKVVDDYTAHLKVMCDELSFKLKAPK